MKQSNLQRPVIYQRAIETNQVGVSSEAEIRHEKKPELAFRFRPITTKLRAENRNSSLFRRVSCRSGRTKRATTLKVHRN